MEDRMSRRAVLGAGGTAAVAALAGCSGGSSSSSGGIDPEAIDDGDRPALGEESAPVTVTVFQDYSCPHCQAFKQQVAPTIVDRYVDPGDVRYLHADFPIPVDEQWSYAIASAAYAVFEEAGNDAFWSFKDEIYAQQGSYSLEVVASVADGVADVGAAAREAAEDGTYRDRIEADRELGLQWGVEATPSVFVDDESVSPDEVVAAIDDRLS
jgi:protein-disulfide isomerase